MKKQEIYVKINKIMKKIKREINDYEKWEWTNIGFHDEFQGVPAFATAETLVNPDCGVYGK